MIQRILFSAILLMTAAGLALSGAPQAAAEIPEEPLSPHFYIDGTVITISGIVAATNGDEFTLDYGEGSITVEMDDRYFFRDTAEEILIPGEQVTVSGVIDDDLLERRSIEAGGVYVHDRSVHYYASFEDEEG